MRPSASAASFSPGRNRSGTSPITTPASPPTNSALSTFAHSAVPNPAPGARAAVDAGTHSSHATTATTSVTVDDERHEVTLVAPGQRARERDAADDPVQVARLEADRA